MVDSVSTRICRDSGRPLGVSHELEREAAQIASPLAEEPNMHTQDNCAASHV